MGSVARGEQTKGARPPRPNELPLIWNNLPEELRQYKQWVIWDWQWRPSQTRPPGQWTKVPKIAGNLSGANASSNRPNTWTVSNEVMNLPRVGFVVTEHDEYCFIDIDNGFDLDTGRPKDWAQAVVNHFPGYWERSASGTGLKGLI